MTEKEESDVFVDYTGYPHYADTRYRDMSKIKTPPFKSPARYREFISGNQKCRCVCTTKYLPRNAILIRPFKKDKAEPIYDLMVKAWKMGRMKHLAHGSCQNFLRSEYLKDEFNYVLKYAKISCIDNIDNRSLKTGDILLTRHGTDLVGKPHLIEGEK